jgi:hypothetical protein
MANERLILAIGQLERALTRLESAHVGLAENLQSHTIAASDELQERHAMLKAAAADALAGIDALLAKAE